MIEEQKYLNYTEQDWKTFFESIEVNINRAEEMYKN